MRKDKVDVERLKRWKAASSESKLEWLHSALEFGKTKKRKKTRR